MTTFFIFLINVNEVSPNLLCKMYVLLIFRYLKFPTPTEVAVVGIDSFKNRYYTISLR